MKHLFSVSRFLPALVGFMSLGAVATAQTAYQPTQVLRDVRILAADSMGGRLPNTPGHALAEQYLVQRFKSIGLKPIGKQYQHTFEFNARANKAPTKGINLVGMIPGKSEKVIVISAHYDHVGTRNGNVFNGADDDASGIGGLLALATQFKKEKPQHTLVFVAFDAEEQGLSGSKAFVDHPPVPLSQIILNVNMDMMSISDKNELYASGLYHYPSLKPMLEKVEVPAGLNLRFGHDLPEQGHDDWTFQSDHGNFHLKKIPFVYFGVEDHPHYHKETDEFQNIHQGFYLKAVETVLRAVRVLDKQLPLN